MAVSWSLQSQGKRADATPAMLTSGHWLRLAHGAGHARLGGGESHSRSRHFCWVKEGKELSGQWDSWASEWLGWPSPIIHLTILLEPHFPTSHLLAFWPLPFAEHLPQPRAYFCFSSHNIWEMGLSIPILQTGNWSAERWTCPMATWRPEPKSPWFQHSLSAFHSPQVESPPSKHGDCEVASWLHLADEDPEAPTLCKSGAASGWNPSHLVPSHFTSSLRRAAHIHGQLFLSPSWEGLDTELGQVQRQIPRSPSRSLVMWGHLSLSVALLSDQSNCYHVCRESTDKVKWPNPTPMPAPPGTGAVDRGEFARGGRMVLFWTRSLTPFPHKLGSSGSPLRW